MILHGFISQHVCELVQVFSSAGKLRKSRAHILSGCPMFMLLFLFSVTVMFEAVRSVDTTANELPHMRSCINKTMVGRNPGKGFPEEVATQNL